MGSEGSEPGPGCLDMCLFQTVCPGSPRTGEENDPPSLQSPKLSKPLTTACQSIYPAPRLEALTDASARDVWGFRMRPGTSQANQQIPNIKPVFRENKNNQTKKPFYPPPFSLVRLSCKYFNPPNLVQPSFTQRSAALS